MPGYRTKVERIAIAGVNDLTIRSLQDRQQYHDPHGAAQRLGICSASWPLFGLLWPSSLQLAAKLARRPVSSHERILEIGCGLAISSLTAHRRGARVTASDRHPLARTFLDGNLDLNRLSPLEYRHGQWGTEGAFCPQDAGAQPLSSRYHLIVGSDILYERSTPIALASFIDEHALPNAEVWIVDPDRGHRNAFSRKMAAFGFHLSREKRLTAPDYRGRLLTYRRYAD